MRNVLAAAAAVFALASPALAALPPSGQGPERMPYQAGHMNRVERMEERIDHAVQAGKLTPEQGQKFKDEAERIRSEVQADRAANGGKLTPEQRAHVKQEMQALRQELRAARGLPPAAK